MRAFLQKLFDTTDFPARWKCGVWSAELGWTHILSDLAIFGAYAAIPVSLIYFVRRRQDVPFLPVFWLFAAFIFACGFGHLIEATIFWHPWYRFSGAVKLFTAVVSWLTVAALIKILPQALTLPGLFKLNRQLEAEVAERKRVEEEIVQINAALENRVAQRTAELEERAAELALTSQYKSEFLANMSHELRTPLNSILILGQNLAENVEGNLTARQIEFSKCIRSAGTDLLNLINEILDLSKVESGTVAVDAEEIGFASLRNTLDRNFRHLAESQNLPFHLEFDRSLPPTLCTDRKRLQQILTNLLSNAFKFTAQGRVDVTVRIMANGFSSNHPVLSHAAKVVAFEVTDTGIGIAREKHKLIFEAFQQADAGTARKYGGTGLGLTISRELAALLGGEIQLMSTPGKGSTFTLYLPVQYPGSATTLGASVAAPVMLSSSSDAITDDPSAATLESLRTSNEVLRGRKALVVDDDARNIFALTTLLEKLQMEVLAATNGRDAIELIERTDDLGVVLMDIMMPDMDGYETIREIRRSPAGFDLPILALTAKAMKGDCEKCLEAGASSYIAKPVNAGQLQSLLLTLFRREDVLSS
jgi:two-component system chemotaxis sensor kinase CheA